MLFSSSVFLFLFFPFVLLMYYGPLRGQRRGQNVFLTIASLLFYAWGEPWFVLVMLGAIAVNYGFGLWIARWKAREVPIRLPLILTVVVNIGLLFVFKYLTFVLINLRAAGLPVLVPVIELPIGISFFTFQAMSYVLDVARGRGVAQRSILNVALYISFFPQLIAGPIVTYETIATQIDGRRETWEDFSAGVCRFLAGLAKKVILSNQLALIADRAFSQDTTLSVSFAWLGAVSYLLQLFFDFSGYSDMAIGMGKMFGFHFLENFNYPFLADSVAGFWRRWHISLTTWFREYLFFPLGGSRMPTVLLNVRNYFVVWLLTGIWHGANWTFLVWGLLNFGMIMWERYGGLGKRMSVPLRHGYTLVVMVLIFVFFRAPDLPAAFRYLGALFGIGGSGVWSAETGYYLRQYWMFLAAALLASVPSATWLKAGLERLPERERRGAGLAFAVCSTVSLTVLFFVASSFVIKGTYNPFIYFNF